eukprot:TRINITY_DN4749_c0_g1_i3.p2 TRINITY_DN4749_c0_g1~~TRINITY_DN4749_c0_g1_i3.p2  ORF type:complete len:218 (-),score=47.99 TRINITY_DN4749_c0_g1_i3:1525-2178(-)
MDDDWDADDFVPAAPLVSKLEPNVNLWAGEDAGEEEVKASWEDEDKPKAILAPARPKAEKKKEKEKPSDSKGKKVGIVDERLADPVAEKLRQQRLVEEADYQATTELFGQTKQEHQTLESLIPKSEEDFLEYAELLALKLKPFEKSYHYLTLVKSLVRLSVTSLKAADAKEVASTLTVIANEKLKVEKDSAGKKKSGMTFFSFVLFRLCTIISFFCW